MSTSPDIDALFIQGFQDTDIANHLRFIQRAAKGPQPYIPIIIASPGGSLVTLTSIIDTLALTDKPVWTVACGYACSAGGLLLAAGTKGHRYVGPNAHVMVHGGQIFNPPQNSSSTLDVLRGMALNEKMANGQVFSLLDRWTGRDSGHWESCILRAHGQCSFYLGEEAVAAGLADHVGLPKEMITWDICR